MLEEGFYCGGGDVVDGLSRCGVGLLVCVAREWRVERPEIDRCELR